jgi:tetratricopeptide (TPR) repeat protein
MLAAVLMASESWGIGDESLQQAAADAADMAVRLDPNLSLAYAVRGIARVLMVPRSSAAGWDSALDNFSRAIEHDGTNATAFAWRAMEYAALGYFDRARQDYGRCLDIDPAYELCRRHLALTYLYLGLTDDAFRLFELNLANGYFGSDTANFAPAAAAHGEPVKALNMITQEFRQEPQLIQPLYQALTDPAFSEHDRQGAIALVDATKGIAYFVPIALWILKAYDKINAKFDPPIWWARGDAAWLTSHGRKQIMQRWHLPDYWRKHGFPPQCAPIGEYDFECH